MSIKSKIDRTIISFLSVNPKWLKSYKYYRTLGKKLDWRHPSTLNEWICRLSIEDGARCWTDLADKYRVREFVKERGLDGHLVRLLGVWHRAEDIDFDALPDAFVLKTNHGCGDVEIIRDKNALSQTRHEEIRQKFSTLLKQKYGRLTAEPHYTRIRPLVIAEELLDASEQEFESTSLVDYKFWMIGGKCRGCMIIYNREPTHFHCHLVDAEWNDIDYDMVANDHCRIGPKLGAAPAHWPEMLRVAERLSKGFPVVRVDLYEVGGKVYFGEMTFTSAGGMMKYFSDGFQHRLGAELTEILTN